MALSLNERRNFGSRKKGIFNKATKIAELFGAQIYIIIRCEGQDYAFSTGGDHQWPSNFHDVVRTIGHGWASCIAMLTNTYRKIL